MAERRKDYDSAYKYLFSNKRIFHQFLTRFVDEGFTKKIKLEDIEQVDRSFVSDEFLQRESDIIYKVKLEGREVYIYVLLEFQSTVDKSIPVRMLLYILQRR
jgi:predicted transposase YdaD